MWSLLLDRLTVYSKEKLVFRFRDGSEISVNHKDSDSNCDISSVKAYRQKILTAKPDPERTEVYKLRGKRV